MAMQGTATPGVYARLKSRCVRHGLVGRMETFPAGAAEWYSSASSSLSFMRSPRERHGARPALRLFGIGWVHTLGVTVRCPFNISDHVSELLGRVSGGLRRMLPTGIIADRSDLGFLQLLQRGRSCAQIVILNRRAFILCSGHAGE